MVIKINIKEIFRVFILCLIFFPYINILNIIKNESIIYSLRLISAFLITILIAKDIKKIKIDFTVLSLFFFSIYIFLISLINSTLTNGITFSIYFTLISSFFIIIVFIKKDYSLFKALHILYSIIIIVNIPSVIKSISLPEYSKTFFVGGKNSLCIVCISAILYNCLYHYLYKSKMTKFGIGLIMISIITMVLSGSSTATLIGIMIIPFILIIKKINISSKYYVLVYCLLLFLVLNTKFIGKIPIFNEFILKILNKDFTFTGRTFIWNNVILYIQNNLMGYGRGNYIVSSFTSTNECHNMFLELLLAGGIPCVIFFLCYLISIFKEKPEKDKIQIININRFLVFSIFVLGLTESIIYNINLWWILIIIYSINKYYMKDTKS